MEKMVGMVFLIDGTWLFATERRQKEWDNTEMMILWSIGNLKEVGTKALETLAGLLSSFLTIIDRSCEVCKSPIHMYPFQPACPNIIPIHANKIIFINKWKWGWNFWNTSTAILHRWHHLQPDYGQKEVEK